MSGIGIGVPAGAPGVPADLITPASYEVYVEPLVGAEAASASPDE